MDLFTSIEHRGRLVIVEGIDGSGKSTQLSLLRKWLESQGYPVVFTEWNSSDLVKDTTKRGKRKQNLTPTTFSLLHATDFADRFHRSVLPPLKAGMVVLADRYIFTAYARDVVRGLDPTWVRNLYSFAVKPDVAFYFRVPIDVAMKRILTGRARLKYYEAGMDLGLSTDLRESFRLFQARILEEYDTMSSEVGFEVIDATLEVHQQQELVRSRVTGALKGYTGKRHIALVPRLYPAERS
ncbi:MAG: thymidylate kinase [Planctomycetes bacterium]|nr:thymidylate kinase [Planctomycetota bacterium]